MRGFYRPRHSGRRDWHRRGIHGVRPREPRRRPQGGRCPLCRCRQEPVRLGERLVFWGQRGRHGRRHGCRATAKAIGVPYPQLGAFGAATVPAPYPQQRQDQESGQRQHPRRDAQAGQGRNEGFGRRGRRHCGGSGIRRNGGRKRGAQVRCASGRHRLRRCASRRFPRDVFEWRGSRRIGFCHGCNG